MAVGAYALTTLVSARDYLRVPVADTTLIERLIDAATAQMETYCGRLFLARDFTEWYDGTGQAWLALPQYPLQSIARISIGEIPVMNIRCDAADATQAYVSVSTTALELYIPDGASAATTSLDYVTYPTLADLATQIGLTAGSWTATVLSDYGPELSPLLRPVGRGWCFEGWATLGMPDEPESGYRVDWDEGMVILSGGRFYSGRRNIYVEYNAGEAAIPADIEQICLELVKRWYDLHNVGNLGLKSERLDTYAYTIDGTTSTGMSEELRYRLDAWREIDIGPIVL